MARFPRHAGWGVFEPALCLSPPPPTPPRKGEGRRAPAPILEASMTANTAAASAHAATIADQFTRQAVEFAASPALHNQAALNLLVDAASPRATDVSLDVACGPGSVV